MSEPTPRNNRNGRILALIIGCVLLVAIVVNGFLTREAFQRTLTEAAAGRLAAVQELKDSMAREHRTFQDSLEQLICVNRLPDNRKMEAIGKGGDICKYVNALRETWSGKP